MNKKKTCILLSLLMMGSMLFNACASKETPKTNDTSQVVSKQQPESEKTEEVKTEKKNPLDALKDEFNKKGFKVGENEELAFGMMGATNGYKFKLNGQLIEFYIYEEDKLTDEGKEMFEQAKNGSVSMSGFNIPVDYANGFVITRLDEHKDKDKIMEVVKNFKH